MDNDNDMRYSMSIRLYNNDEKCFGPGIAELLRRVQTLHSLRAAAISMGMAYSKAWRIVRESEAALGFALLSSQTGGVNGGGAELTKQGASTLARYDELVRETEAAASMAFMRLFGE